MKAYVIAVMVLLFLAPVFAAKNIHDCWKLDKKLHKDPNVIKVQEDYVVQGDKAYDVFTVYVKDCYNKESLHRIPTWYKSTEVRIHCSTSTNK